MARFKAFISYKHVTSTRFAENLELAMKAYAKPIYRRPMAMFRDDKYLRPGIDLPALIREALGQAEFLIYLASPEAAASNWVQAELEQWCADAARRQRLIIVLTDGRIVADAQTKRLDWTQTDALPPTLAETLVFVPLYVDLTWARSEAQQTLRDPGYKNAVNAIVAALRGVDPIELSGQEILQHRRNIRIRNALIGAIGGLAVLLAGAAWFAWDQMSQATARAREATSRRLAAESDRLAEGGIDGALLLMAQAYRMGDNTALRGSWWRLLGASSLPAAYLRADAEQLRFEPDGRLEVRTPNALVWFSLQGARWARQPSRSAEDGAAQAIPPTGEWAEGCEDAACEPDSRIWKCAQTDTAMAAPQGDQRILCLRSEIRIPGWCGRAAIEVPGYHVRVRHIGDMVHVETDQGSASYACGSSSAVGRDSQSERRPVVMSGSPGFFPDDELKRFAVGGSAVKWASRSFDERWLAVLRDGAAEVWHLEPRGAKRARPGADVLPTPGPVRAIAAARNGAIALAVPGTQGRDGDVLFWKQYSTALAGTQPELMLRQIWPGGRDGTVTLVDAHTSEGRYPGVLALSPAGERLAAGRDLMVSIWDTATGSKLERDAQIGRKAALAATLSPEGALLGVISGPLVGGEDRYGQIFGLARGAKSRARQRGVQAIAFDSGGAAVIFADASTIRLGSATAAGQARSLGNYRANHLAVEPEQRLLAASLTDHSLLVRRLDEPAEVVRSAARSERAKAIAFMARGEVVLRAAADALEAWDWRANSWYTVGAGAHEAVTALPGGLALALAEGRAVIYDLDPAHWLTLTCDIVRRNLSREEWYASIGEGVDYECACSAYPPGEGWPADSCNRQVQPNVER